MFFPVAATKPFHQAVAVVAPQHAPQKPPKQKGERFAPWLSSQKESSGESRLRVGTPRRQRGRRDRRTPTGALNATSAPGGTPLALGRSNSVIHLGTSLLLFISSKFHFLPHGLLCFFVCVEVGAEEY